MTQLGSLKQCAFSGIFLDLKKAYNAIIRDRYLKILRTMGVGENTLWLIARFWRELTVLQGGGVLWPPF